MLKGRRGRDGDPKCQVNALYGILETFLAACIRLCWGRDGSSGDKLGHESVPGLRVKSHMVDFVQPLQLGTVGHAL